MKKFKDYSSKEKRNCAIFIVLSLVIIVGLTINFSLRKNIILVEDGVKRNITTYKGTVEGVLQENQILLSSKDKITPALDSKLSKNDTINIKKAVNISVKADGNELAILSAEENVSNMLKAEGISIDENDKVFPSNESALEEGSKIEIVRVDIKEQKESKPINYETVVKKDENYLDSYAKTLKEGKNGEKEVTNKVIYENGEEVSREIISEVVTKEPVSKEIVQGTQKTYAVNRGSNPFGNAKKINVKATAYSPINGAKTAYTASGMKATRNPNGYSTIAVDPSVIPLGTKVYIEGYGYAIAADTGKSIKGNFIDVFFNTYNESCNWGLKYVNLYVLE